MEMDSFGRTVSLTLDALAGTTFLMALDAIFFFLALSMIPSQWICNINDVGNTIVN
jgi:hypothetical protein